MAAGHGIKPAALRAAVDGLFARIAGREESFQTGKDPAGLDEHQHRRRLPWRRWTVFAMLAHALLAVTAAEHARTPPPPGPTALTCRKFTSSNPPAGSPARTPGQPGDAATSTEPEPATTSANIHDHHDLRLEF